MNFRSNFEAIRGISGVVHLHLPVQAGLGVLHTPLVHVLVGLPVKHGVLQVYVTTVPVG